MISGIVRIVLAPAFGTAAMCTQRGELWPSLVLRCGWPGAQHVPEVDPVVNPDEVVRSMPPLGVRGASLDSNSLPSPHRSQTMRRGPHAISLATSSNFLQSRFLSGSIARKSREGKPINSLFSFSPFLLFSVIGTSVAAIAVCQLLAMHAGSPEQFGRPVWWAHFPVFFAVVSIVGFVRLYFNAGRLWLGCTACGLRLLDLVLHCLSAPNLNYKDITGLRHLTAFGGETISVAEGTENPWIKVNGCDAMAGVEATERRLLVSTRLTGASEVSVSVTDQGCGIPHEKIERIFEPFFTTKTQGMGLGLTVCRTIISAHGGKLWATNNAGRGATFQFTLPATERGAG